MNRLNKWGLALLLSLAAGKPSVAQQGNAYLPSWKQGYLDIHQISTGRGNAAFAILPDGTTMIIDAGDLGDTTNIKQQVMPALPNSSKFPGEWIAKYIQHFSAPLAHKGTIDYVWLTHHHMDHVGGVYASAPRSDKGYVLSGITQVAEELRFRKLIDRSWPGYDYPSKEDVYRTTPDFQNYLNFLDYQEKHHQLIVEGFKAGSRNQFVLRYHPEKYPNFEVRNIYSSGEIWTGQDEQTKMIFPPMDSLKDKRLPSENMCSSVIKLTYGKFDYYTGGDLTGRISEESPAWRDVETPVGRLVGPVEVAVLDHHGYSDAMNASIVSSLRPAAFIIPVWDYYHPQPEVLAALLDKNLYPGQRYIFATGLVSGNRERLGDMAKSYQPTGHIVTRVYPGGEQYQVYVLDATTTDYKIIYKTDKISCH